MPPDADADALARHLAALLDRHGGPLALYAARWTTAADDCVQEALVLLAAQPTVPDNPVAWLYRVVKHRALNRARGERRRTLHEQQAWQRRLPVDPGDEVRRELLDAVAALPAEHGEVVLLKTWGGLTFAEIAEVVGESSSTVHRRYQSALEQLRKLWRTPCPPIE